MKLLIINRMRSKKGDIPITILVLGVVLICILTIASFYLASYNMNKNFDVQAVKEIALAKEKIDFYQNIGVSRDQADSFVGVKTDTQGRYLSTDWGFISVRYNLP